MPAAALPRRGAIGSDSAGLASGATGCVADRSDRSILAPMTGAKKAIEGQPAPRDGAALRPQRSAYMSRTDSLLAGRLIFVVGARRSGTYWVQRILAAHPEVASVPSESHLFSHGIAPLFERFRHTRPDVGGIGSTYIDRDVLLDAGRRFCDRVLGESLEPGKKFLVERTPLHVLHLGLMASLYPDGRFVHVVRDGRDVARSLLANEWGPRRIDEAAREWARCARAGLRDAPDGTVEVRYEDLLADPDRGVRRLYEGLRLPATPDALARGRAAARTHVNPDPAETPAGSGKWRAEFSRRELRAFERLAGDVLDELEYPRVASAPARRSPANREAGGRVRGPLARTWRALVRRDPPEAR